MQFNADDRTPSKIPTYFHVECSVCSRPLRVRVEYLGRQVACGHCGHDFVATDAISTPNTARSSLEKAEQLLARYSNTDSAQ